MQLSCLAHSPEYSAKIKKETTKSPDQLKKDNLLCPLEMFGQRPLINLLFCPAPAKAEATCADSGYPPAASGHPLTTDLFLVKKKKKEIKKDPGYPAEALSSSTTTKRNEKKTQVTQQQHQGIL